ncbi:type I secretion system protein [Nitratireductor aestuarii]|uniref:Membrane fusion protein (MFP) family protein n=1 Tax=Nitratireductor aestuarii TaxID=1735103 RepID=A0A916W6Q6_9HYPH|nr:HlyD family type I secretion periplasmic adaptor subunit [Nitratireductor aestuarii]GGA71870.1 type I secretion system protein [Nitratireductor aestuarii]
MAATSGSSPAWTFENNDAEKDRRTHQFIALVTALFATAVAWSWFAELDEVSTGSGKVVPSRQEQVIQSLEGGVLAQLYVRENEVVEPGQVLAQLDQTMSESSVEESAARYRAALASVARLTAEVNGGRPQFPSYLDDYPDLVAAETELFEARRKALEEETWLLDQSIELVGSELAINQKLTTSGAASNVEVIRLKRQLVELQLKQAETQSNYVVRAREELAKASAEVSSLSSVVRGRSDTLSRLTLRSPVRGVVQNIEVNTIGGVVPPNGKLMGIIPIDDQLIVEARVSPRDIAYIHPGQKASVKITAYDYAVFGDLDGEVRSISPDTMQDETNPQVYYYRVFIETATDALENKAGERFSIVPGMVATVDIHTGSKTVFEYLVKPFNKAGEALRER